MFPLSKRNSNIKYNDKILELEKQRKKTLKNKWVWSCKFLKNFVLEATLHGLKTETLCKNREETSTHVS